MKWPLGLAAFAIVGYGLSGAIGEQFENPEGGESGFDAVMMGLAIALFFASVLAFPLAVITGVAALSNHEARVRAPDPAAARRPSWSVSHNAGLVLALVAYACWLGFVAFLWLGTWTGGGGLDGPCQGQWAGERGGTYGNCTTEFTAWPPASTRVVITSQDGHFERVYPSTLAVIVLTGIALLPLTLWPPVRWFMDRQREGPAPLRRLAWLAGVTAILAVAAGVLIDENTSRSLTEDERVALEHEESSPVPVPTAPPPPVLIDPTRVAPNGVGLAVSRAQGGGTTSCAAGTDTGLGLWTCVTRAADGSELSSRVTINADGTYTGWRIDAHGFEHFFRGCCVRVMPET